MIAAAQTQTQTVTQQRRAHRSTLDLSLNSDSAHPLPVMARESMMKSAELQLMKPLLNFLQLLCENHNIKLQVCGGC